MRGIAAISTLVVLCLGCGGEGWLAVSIETNGITVPDELDRIEVQVVASRTSCTEEGEAQTCRIGQSTFDLNGDVELPATVLVVPGESEWRCVAFRVLGTRLDTEVLRTEALYCPSLKAPSEATISLDSVCHHDHDPPECGPLEICQDLDGEARCVPSDAGSLFEIEPLVDQRCDGQ
jgi:hypothetical protein